MTAQTKSAGPSEPLPSHMTRKTKGGRNLLYQLTIVQEPERARACGSGSKSAADRRPVDPPPVVELRIFELTPGQEDNLDIKAHKDITFHYNANFFLFATLEPARTMAHGRVQTPATTSTPVLTGMPVSGMAYLDRPKEAGYFLFPDLSVRHEGRYKLSFNLYEETKEDKDSDEEMSNPKHSPVDASFDWRMEVKSQAFMVFSAKKFPGLAESTTLSRTVAEQGCRVRIRRDVRMRRRDGKPSNNDYKKVDDDYGQRATGRTPERQMPDYHRQRSASAASDHSRMGYGDPQRRPSVPGYPSAQAPPPPPPGYGGNSGGQHLVFGGPHASQQYAGPQPPQPMSSPVTAHPSSTQPSPYQTSPYGYTSRPSSQAHGSEKSEYGERRFSNTSQGPPHQYALSVSTNGTTKMEADTMAGRRPSQAGRLAPLGPENNKKSNEKSIQLPGIEHLLNGAGPSTTMPASDTNSIAVDDNPGPVEHPHARFATGSKRPHADSSDGERLANGARPSSGEDRGCRFPNPDGSIGFPGLPLTSADGVTKIMQENTFWR